MTQNVEIIMSNLETFYLCAHGTCELLNNCICDSGWTGNSCDTN